MLRHRRSAFLGEHANGDAPDKAGSRQPVRIRRELVAIAVVTLSVLPGGGCDSDLDLRMPDPAVRYIAFGDSTTAGPAARDYIDVVAERSNLAADAFANEGKGGEPSDEGVSRLDRLLTDGIYPNAVALWYWQGGGDLTAFIADNDPFLVLDPSNPAYPFAGQLSDALDRIEQNVGQAVRRAREAGLAVAVATYFPLAPNIAECDPLPLNILLPLQADIAGAYIALLNNRLRTVALTNGAAVVDVAASGPLLQADPANYLNCNHLSGAGNELVAELFLRLVN